MTDALENDDGAAIQICYRGLRHAPRYVMQRLARYEEVDPADCYCRTVPELGAPAGKSR